jgi:DinB superfamily
VHPSTAGQWRGEAGSPEVSIERCAECGFDGDQWGDDEALAAVAELPSRWSEAIAGLDDGDLQRRPIPDLWSIAEYSDHVRETAFNMRFILDVALADSGTDLGSPPEPRFDLVPRTIDAEAALNAFEHEILELCDRLRGTPGEQWRSAVIIGGERLDVGWIVRHALHDVTHHIGDVRRLRSALG